MLRYSRGVLLASKIFYVSTLELDVHIHNAYGISTASLFIAVYIAYSAGIHAQVHHLITSAKPVHTFIAKPSNEYTFA